MDSCSCDDVLIVKMYCVIVLVTAIRSGTRDAECIAVETKYPADFVSIVLAMPAFQRIFFLASAIALRQAVLGEISREIENRDHVLMEEVCAILQNEWDVGSA